MNKKNLLDVVCPETAHWRANHDNLKKRCALLSQRPDLPVDRIPAFMEMKRLQEVESKTNILKTALETICSYTVLNEDAKVIQDVAEDALTQYELCQDPVCPQAGQPHAHVEVQYHGKT